MTGPPTDAIHGVNRLTRTSCPLPPLMFNTFQENVNTLRQTSSEGHSVRRGRSAFWVYTEKTGCEILNLR